jgi:hypothetical protein
MSILIRIGCDMGRIQAKAFDEPDEGWDQE